MSYILSGKVIHGDNYGKKIGFPTINLDRRNFLKLEKKPDFGIYSGIVTLENKKYKSGVVIGPLDKKGLPKIEAHLIGYNGNAYGKYVQIEILKFLRKYKNFKTEKELITQITKDIEICKKINL
ncbi:MAG: riboflavin kinase [Patescibacteria group bacterium]